MTVLQAQELPFLLLAFTLLWPLNFYLFIYFNSTATLKANCGICYALIYNYNNHSAYSKRPVNS